jgi:hypothetical protein
MTKNIIILIIFCLLALSVLDLLPDPYYHRSKVNFWTWAKREIIEALTFERE